MMWWVAVIGTVTPSAIVLSVTEIVILTYMILHSFPFPPLTHVHAQHRRPVSRQRLGASGGGVAGRAVPQPESDGESG